MTKYMPSKVAATLHCGYNITKDTERLFVDAAVHNSSFWTVNLYCLSKDNLVTTLYVLIPWDFIFTFYTTTAIMGCGQSPYYFASQRVYLQIVMTKAAAATTFKKLHNLNHLVPISISLLTLIMWPPATTNWQPPVPSVYICDKLSRFTILYNMYDQTCYVLLIIFSSLLAPPPPSLGT